MKSTNTIQLQGLGLINGIETEKLEKGMKLCWNYSYGEYEVVSCVQTSKCFYTLTEKNIKKGTLSERKIKIGKIVGVATDKEKNIIYTENKVVELKIEGKKEKNVCTEEKTEEIKTTIKIEEVEKAYKMTSYTPKKRAEEFLKELNRMINNIKKDKIKLLEEKAIIYLEARKKTVSSVIVGFARFNNYKEEKKQSIALKKYEDMINFYKKYKIKGV